MVHSSLPTEIKLSTSQIKRFNASHCLPTTNDANSLIFSGGLINTKMKNAKTITKSDEVRLMRKRKPEIQTISSASESHKVVF